MTHSMNIKTHSKTAYLLYIGVGFIFGLCLNQIHEVFEQGVTLEKSFYVVLSVLIGVGVAQFLAKHVSCCDHVHNPTKDDKVFLGLIALASLVHTFFDGALFALTIQKGVQSLLVLLLMISIHEMIRITALYTTLKSMSYTNNIVTLVTLGASSLGIGLGVLVVLAGISVGEGTLFYEISSYLSIGLYTLIATDIFLWLRNKFKQDLYFSWSVIGILIAYVLSLMHQH